MATTKGKIKSLSVDEQLSIMEGEKEKGLSTNHGRSIYKQQSGQYKEGELKSLLSMSLEQVADFAQKINVSLSDINEVRKRTIIYLRCCQETGTFPSNLGLARSLGYSDRALRMWRAKHPDTETGHWLEMFSELCADILHQSALKNNANPIISIFISKALYDMREENHIVIKNGNNDWINKQTYDEQRLREIYGMLSTGDEEE